jgi:hypothetical protein
MQMLRRRWRRLELVALAGRRRRRGRRLPAATVFRRGAVVGVGRAVVRVGRAGPGEFIKESLKPWHRVE